MNQAEGTPASSGPLADRLARFGQLALDPRFTWLLVAIGVLLRLVHYLQGFSLSVDESHLALNILGRSYAGLLEPLGDRQGAPVGYLFLVRAAVNLFGDSEYALRLVAFVCGVLALVLFRFLAVRLLSPAAVPVAVGLFALSHFLIFYSAQVKQYASDALVAVALVLLDGWMRRRGPAWWAPLLHGIVGGMALWLSHPALFVLGGLGLASLWLDVVRAGPGRRTLATLVPIAMWAASFALSYRLSLRSLTHHAWLLEYWKDAFMPFPPRSPEDVQWFVLAFFSLFTRALGFSLQGICALAFVVGLATLALDRERRRALATLLLPLGLALAASALHRYPFDGRLMLFATPALLLLMGEGASAVLHATRSRPVIGTTLVALLFLHPAMWAGYHLAHSRVEEDIKPALAYLREHREPGDVVYVYYRAVPAFTYYARRYGFSWPDCCVVGVDSRQDWNGYDRDLARLGGSPRTWIVFSHIYRWVNVDDEDLFRYFLGHGGVRLDALRTNRAAVYLYDLTHLRAPCDPGPSDPVPAERAPAEGAPQELPQ